MIPTIGSTTDEPRNSFIKTNISNNKIITGKTALDNLPVIMYFYKRQNKQKQDKNEAIRAAAGMNFSYNPKNEL